VRGYFDSTVRIVCFSPQTENTTQVIPFEVSLNGVDWTETGFTFRYFEEPTLSYSFPDMGPVQGGTEVFIVGANFPNITNTGMDQDFNCRFTPMTLQMEPKIMPAFYKNSTHIMCPTPGGWSQGDKMHLQITFNGVDYDDKNFEFTEYNIHKAFPRSGPSNGLGGPILIQGEGFKQDEKTRPLCSLNRTVYEPIAVKWNEIQCPMPRAQSGDDFWGTVEFAVSANGHDWHEFDGGFQYYEQIIVSDIFPKTGPSQGIGIVNFYGKNFRKDSPLLELGCRIGKSIGQAVYVSKTQMRCVVEDIETVAEGERLPA